MRSSPFLSFGPVVLLASLAMPCPATFGQDLAVREHRADSSITAVTVYANRAGVTRTASSPAEAGIWDVRLGGLPSWIEAESLQAKVTGGKLLDVRYEQRTIATDAATDPELRAAIARLDDLRRARQERDFAGKVLEGEGKLLESITARIADTTAKEAGGAIEPARLGEQMDFLAGRRKQLAGAMLALLRDIQGLEDEIRAAEADVKRRGGASRVERDAIVTVATTGGAAAIELTYLVTEAGWRPSYAVRADSDANALSIEFDAVIRQASGEDWNGVKLAVSTAEPSRRPLPPGIPPVFVEPLPPPPPVEGGTGGGGLVASRKAGMPPTAAYDAAPGSPGGVFGTTGEASEELRRVLNDAEAITSGAVVSYAIPRPVSIASDDSAERKTRVATIEARPTFSLVTRPIVDPAVYAKAIARNDSPYLLIGGPASVFVGGDSVGTARLDDVPPGGEMTFWLGADRRVEAKRSLVSRNAERSGVFTKDDVTTWKWKIELVNTGASAVDVVVDDRVPVSRDERIKVELKDLSQPLSTDPKYLADERPQGTLRWIVKVPARPANTAPVPVATSWTTVLKRPLDLEITPVPD